MKNYRLIFHLSRKTDVNYLSDFQILKIIRNLKHKTKLYLRR